MARADSPELKVEPHRRLAEGCTALGLSLQPVQLQQLEQYLALLVKWNRAYNLTAVRDEQQMVTRHLLDSLVIAPFVTQRRWLDVGTGAGLPGVPLAILYPDKDCHLLDSNGKKTRFLFQVKTALGLDNMTVHQARVESFAAAAPYDAILSRAFASLDDMVQCCRHLLATDGRFLAMKGAQASAELEALTVTEFESVVHPLSVPGLAESRYLVELRPSEALQCRPSTTSYPR